MFFLSRVSFFILCAAFSFLAFTSASFASEDKKKEKPLSLEEVRVLIDELGTGGDATKGPVPVNSELDLYDIYARQIAYRENSKEFRASLEERRENYKKAYVQQRDDYKALMEKIYRAEIAAYQKDMNKKKKDSDEMKKDAPSGMKKVAEKPADKKMSPKEPGSVSDSEDMQGEEKADLKEQEIPSEDGEEEDVKRKVVTSEDAPDFDPSDLPVEDEGDNDAVVDEEVPAEEGVESTEDEGAEVTDEAPM